MPHSKIEAHFPQRVTPIILSTTRWRMEIYSKTRINQWYQELILRSLLILGFLLCTKLSSQQTISAILIIYQLGKIQEWTLPLTEMKVLFKSIMWKLTWQAVFYRKKDNLHPLATYTHLHQQLAWPRKEREIMKYQMTIPPHQNSQIMLISMIALE